jgi:methylthioribose-1-phosphate isomerase
MRESARLKLIMEGFMDTEKKPDEQKTDESKKQDVGEIVGDLVVSGATVLAHSAAEAVVKRVKKAAAKSAPVKAVKRAAKKAEEVGG